MRIHAAPALIALHLCISSPAPAQEKEPADNDDAAAIAQAVEVIVSMQEGSGIAEWPYEGVYRVREAGQRGSVIPIGYRVGGTAICALSLLHAPGLDDDEARREAIDRATGFVIEGIHHPLMSFQDYAGGYDVRGWGYAYGLAYLLRVKSQEMLSEHLAEGAENAIKFYIDALEALEIPEVGGWTYSRRGAVENPSPVSPFMTGPCLQALFQAEAQGYDVDADVVTRALDALQKARVESGAFVYSGTGAQGNARAAVPGASARMAVAETTLYLAGRSTLSNVRGAVDAFIVHWEWLDQRRAKTGTHVGPYGIAPYYFYFGHYYAAQAIELLPPADRDEYRRKLRDLVFNNRLEDGSWNDRVFERSANYGSAMCIMALMMKDMPAPAAWEE